MSTDVFTRDYIESYSKKQQEPTWMTDMRLNAFDVAQKTDMPKPDKTKITRWDFNSFEHVTNQEEAKQITLTDLPEGIKKFVDTEKKQNLLVLRDTVKQYVHLTSDLMDQGVILTDLQTAITEYPELVQKYFMTDAVQVSEHKLTALHAALVNGGAFIYVPKNVIVNEPIQTIFWQDNPSQALFNHVILVAEENSEVTYVENYLATETEAKTVMNVISEVFAGANAKISYGSVDHFAHGTTSYINRRGLAERDATIEWALGQMNDGDTISENVTHLLGDQSVCFAKAVSVGRGDQTQNFTAHIVNHGKHTNGIILQHGVMKDRATGIFHGIGKIEHGGTKANAEQESRVLMLSKHARGDANPILLIDEDDVTAGHAASVGRVDPLQLYYLMSRGISRQEAERLIIHGFLAPVVNEIPIQAVRDQLTDVIEGKVN
ncbi:FeS cluster assembly protein SufD [Halolactibacillus alkaliphilus]|uniref:FeS cluster assembly protein SufD n=1 Tax=Halolactibacillus alkaliphilus TaxID=442899 RepID=A0A511X340_9BACI|nr:Fe-S cluster assembly protein SufD [Halolactibacillus alkaliphilus]GEN57352.1 FeS cluster assembly protein SufD [Halolactibacillus alkaliphilus]GGN73082.1 FeS cluster assembly protein SufD [Halolactibacillus alkaliphilus]SFO94461.1 Fe-S cluster assembly protein SufD [Halolactibacillus alkaliphilus]